MSKKSAFNDPFADREAQKYENPIPSREVILALLEKSSGPLTRRDISNSLKLGSEEQLEALRRRLRAMERDGQIISNRKGAYGRIDKMDLVKGVVQGHRDGFGFVIPHDGSEDVYLSNRQMRKVFHGDEVLVRPGPLDFKGRRDGSIVEVLTHNTQQLVGRYFYEKGICFVRPDNTRLGHDVIIPPENVKNAKHGQFVLIDIIQQPDRRGPPAGNIIEIMGEHLAPGMEIDVAIRSHNIPHLWPVDVEEQIKEYSREVSEKDKGHRVDLREHPFVTIDGEDARDFDDAVYCEEKKAGGWRLFVAIADVSHYVEVGSALDREAAHRGTSVYFPDYVVPMLPEILSNGLCSLNPQVDRLCMVCEMTISAIGKVSGYKFYEAVMHSHARLTYTEVGSVIDDRNKKRSGVRQQFHEILPQIDVLHDLYQTLRANRDTRGAIDFETKETRILFDDERKIKKIVPTERNEAHKLIEECMLAANVCAAKFLEFHKIPSLYRVHESPREEKIKMLQEFLGELGISMYFNGDVGPEDYQNVLQHVADRPDAKLIQTVMLRSMNQAVYQPENQGHFGLAYQAYAHFTSPIRRYPDLLVHRAIRSIVRSKIETAKVRRVKGAKPLSKASIYPYGDETMVNLGEQCSLNERRADEATRDVVNWLKCEYLRGHVGESFEGVISAVTAFGVFVELKEMYVEGLVHITALPQDYYHHEAAHHRLVGERTRRVFRLGDELDVQVVRVNLDERTVDFELNQIKPRKRHKVKISSKAKELTEEYKNENVRREGGRGDTKKTVSASAEKKTKNKKKKTISKRGSTNKSTPKKHTKKPKVESSPVSENSKPKKKRSKHTPKG